MLTGISWNTYFLYTALLTGIYYLGLYLSGRVNNWRENRKGPPENGGAGLASPSANSTGLNLSGEPEAHACLDELTAFFESASGPSWDRDRLLASLQHILCKYPGIQHSEYQSQIARVIVSYSEYHCAVELKVEELNELWHPG